MVRSARDSQHNPPARVTRLAQFVRLLRFRQREDFVNSRSNVAFLDELRDILQPFHRSPTAAYSLDVLGLAKIRR